MSQNLLPKFSKSYNLDTKGSIKKLLDMNM